MYVHRLLHLALGMPSVAAKENAQYKNEHQTKTEYVMHSVAIVKIYHAYAYVMLYVFGFQKSLARPWWILKASTDSIHYCLCFKLASVS